MKHTSAQAGPSPLDEKAIAVSYKTLPGDACDAFS